MGIKDRYLRWSEWQKWCLDLFYKPPSTEAADDMGESPAIEVLKFRDPEGHFAGKNMFVHSTVCVDIFNKSYYFIFTKVGKLLINQWLC